MTRPPRAQERCGQLTKIEWTDATWNPVTGCTKVSAGCKNCYGERIAKRFWGERKFTDVQCHADRLDQPLHWKKPRRVFVNSMSDLFHEDVPDDFIADVFGVIMDQKAQRHTFQILTKRPYRMMKWFKAWINVPLHNIWLGVSVENQDEVWRIETLLQTPAAVRFVSCEPLLDAIGLNLADKTHLGGAPWGDVSRFTDAYVRAPYNALDWIIVGGESGPGARPMNPDWARSIRDQCQAAGVPFFMKQMSKKAPIPDDLMIREYP